MVLSVVGIDTICRHNNSPISLISINGSRPDARVSVNSSKNEPVRFEAGEGLVEIRLEKRAVSLLNDDRIRRSDDQIRNNLATMRAFDRDPDSLANHLGEGISQIRLEFLAHPDDGMTTLPHHRDEIVN